MKFSEINTNHVFFFFSQVYQGCSAGDNLLIWFWKFDGAPVNPDAQIFRVNIGTPATIDSDILDRTNIIAGMTAGADGIFGSGDEVVIPTSGTPTKVISKIANVVLNGLIAGRFPSQPYGIEAQEITAITVKGAPVSLSPGPDNDLIRSLNGSPLNVFEAGALGG